MPDRVLGPRPAQALILGYLGVILVGTLLLLTPAAAGARPVTGLDALFTATSAVCVTGLVVVDTETAWSGFGQAVILVLFQVGGLGIMTFSTFLLLALRGRPGMTAREATGDSLGAGAGPRLGPTLKAVFATTAVLELCGAGLLWLAWTFGTGRAAQWGPLERAWHALFHSVSAFCNAGFSTLGEGLAAFVGSYATNAVIMALIVIGGIGFVVLIDLRRWLAARGRGGGGRLSSHTRLALAVTAVLIPAGALLIYVCERGNPETLGRLGSGQKLMACLFQSVTARTAGFNTVAISSMTPAALFVIVLLMIVGASPCGTGGGIKTTTLGVILATAWSRLRGREEVECFGRTVPRETITRSGSLVVLSLAMIAAVLLLLLVTAGVRPGTSFIAAAFEVVSAFGTVGLSAGVTAELAPHGKLLIVLTMLVGRVGPLAAAVALSRQRRRQLVRLPDGEFLVG